MIKLRYINSDSETPFGGRGFTSLLGNNIDKEVLHEFVERKLYEIIPVALLQSNIFNYKEKYEIEILTYFNLFEIWGFHFFKLFKRT
jgi:hypothetical protein